MKAKIFPIILIVCLLLFTGCNNSKYPKRYETVNLTLSNYEYYLVLEYTESFIAPAFTIKTASTLLLFDDVTITYKLGETLTIKLTIGGSGSSILGRGSDTQIIGITGKVKVPV